MGLCERLNLKASRAGPKALELPKTADRTRTQPSVHV
jgi:hypothetical protein